MELNCYIFSSTAVDALKNSSKSFYSWEIWEVWRTQSKKFVAVIIGGKKPRNILLQIPVTFYVKISFLQISDMIMYVINSYGKDLSLTNLRCNVIIFRLKVTRDWFGTVYLNNNFQCLNNTISIFITLCNSHVFSQYLSNITRNLLLNKPQIWDFH